MKEESRLMRRMSLAEIRIRELEAELAALQEVYDHAMNELYPTVAAERDDLVEQVFRLHEITFTYYGGCKCKVCDSYRARTEGERCFRAQ